MATTARLDLTVWRNDDVYEFALRVRGPDLTSVFMKAQIRLAGDTPGAPLVNLDLVSNANAEGIRLAGVSVVDGVTVNDVRIRINKGTRQALPYAGEIGDATKLAWGMLIDGITRIEGAVILPAQVYGSDNAPANRPAGGGMQSSGYPAGGAELTIAGDDVAVLTIDGYDLVAQEAGRAADAAAQAVAAATKVQSVPNGRPELVFLDSDQRLIFRADETTNATIDAAARGVILITAERAARAAAERRARVAALRDTLHILIYGQSLAYGYGTGPVVSGAAPIGALRFNGGVRPLDGGAGGRTSFVPLTETNGGTNGGETVATGAAIMLAQLLADEDETRLAEVGAFLFSDPAEGGTPVAGLVSGTAPFSRLQDDVTAARQLAGPSYALSAMLWLQGESDQPPGASTTAAAYMAALRQLRVDAQARGRAASGQAGDIMPLLTYQTATLGGADATGSTRPTISLAQLALADDDQIAMVGPAYPYPYYGGYDIHLSSQGERLMGAAFGLGLKRWLIDGVRPRVIRPRRSLAGGSLAVRDGATATIRFEVPSGTPLVLDQAKFPALPSGGFTLAKADGSAIVISAVEVIAPDAVRITAASAIPAGASIRYGWTGQAVSGGAKPFLQGCLRDSAGEAMIFDPTGDAWPMHHWCAIFEEVLA